MLVSTQGIVLRTIRYSETSIIAHIYTRSYGIQGFMVNGVRSAKGKLRNAHFQQLTILEMVNYQRPGGDLQRIKEARPAFFFQDIPGNPAKTLLAMWMAELLTRTLREEESNEEMFAFIEEAIRLLDKTNNSLANYPLAFMVHLSRYLGFFPSAGRVPNKPYFNLYDGCFAADTGASSEILGEEEGEALAKLCELPFSSFYEYKMKRSLRNSLMEGLMNYYRYHIEGLGKLNSASVLSEVLR